MTINLSEVSFDNDFFEVSLPTGELLVLNSLDESIQTDDNVSVVDRINIAVVDEDNEQHICSGVIGMSNDWFSLASEYPQYVGKGLTRENMRYCTIEVAE